TFTPTGWGNRPPSLCIFFPIPGNNIPIYVDKYYPAARSPSGISLIPGYLAGTPCRDEGAAPLLVALSTLLSCSPVDPRGSYTRHTRYPRASLGFIVFLPLVERRRVHCRCEDRTARLLD